MSEGEEAPVRPGDVLAGKYEVERVLGVGGMGVVVAANHVQLKDKVALKFLLPQVTESPEHVARFLREAQAAVRIKSIHVARVVDVGVLETGSPYMVMEYLEGQDLGQILHEHGRLAAHEVLTYVLQACEAIAEAHAYGIVHRDLKPSNLFLTRSADGSPCIKVLDFGISKNTRPGVDNLTRTQSVIGSPLYMSPEQMRSARQVDVRADIWSLGVMLYELIVGEVPFLAESMPQLVALVLEGNAPKLREMLPDANEALESIVAKCLERKADDRYQTVGPLAADIASVLGTEEARVSAARIARVLEGAGTRVEGTGQYSALPAPAAGLGALTRPGVQTGPGVALGQTGGDVQVAPKKKPLGLIVGGVVGALALVGGLVFAFGGKPPAQPGSAAQGVEKGSPETKGSTSAATSASIERAAATPSVAPSPSTPVASASASTSASAVATASAKPTTTVRPPPFAPSTRTTAPATTTAKPVEDDIFKKRQG